MEDELMLHVMLEAHDQVVPNCAESIMTLTHFLNYAGVEVRIEVPTLDITHVAPLDGHCETERDREPCVIVCRVCKSLLLV